MKSPKKKTKKPSKVISINKKLSEKSAKDFNDSIISGDLYRQLKGKNPKKRINKIILSNKQ